MSQAVKYVFISLGIVAGWALLILMTGGHSHILYVPWVYYILTRQVSLFAGIALFLLRLFKWIPPQSLLYILAGTLNACIGIVAIVLYLAGHASQDWLNACLYNLLLSLLMLADAFVFSAKNAPKSNG